ncbi:MAG: 4-hydroxy-3-methylbut-2-enyl diphosphate reductase [Bacteroidia bacterium]
MNISSLVSRFLPSALKPRKFDLSVHVDPASGFCFGVIYAIEMAEDILREEGHLYCLGDIVHNDREVMRLTEMGLEIIDHTRLQEIRDAKVLIRAHGEPPETYQLAIQNNLALVDASCPVVLKLQNRIRSSYERQEPIVIYGKADHAEVIGLQGQTRGESIVFHDLTLLDRRQLPNAFTLYSQTTKNKRSFYSVVEKLREEGFQVKAHDTICRQVSNRDQEIRYFAETFDRVIFVAGTKSSNGKMLYGVCKQANPNTHFISSTEEIEQAWFRPAESVGICGATSTPKWLMDEVKSVLLNF